MWMGERQRERVCRSIAVDMRQFTPVEIDSERERERERECTYVSTCMREGRGRERKNDGACVRCRDRER